MQKTFHVIIAIFVVFSLFQFAFAEIYEGVDIPEGAVSFADEVVSYSPGSGVDLSGPFSNPEITLGEPTNTDVNLSLGVLGELILKFVDNSLTTSGNSANDLWIFERGTVEPTNIAVSVDGNNWIEVGQIAGSVSGIDIDAFLNAGIVLWEKYQYIRITDAGQGLSVPPHAGADIDAVAAISSDPPAPENNPPSAEAGGDQTVQVGDPVTLNGSNSTDSDGSIVLYEWEQLTGSPIALSILSDSSREFTAPGVATAESFIFQLKVTDDDGDTAIDTCIVNVVPGSGGEQPPIASISPVEQKVSENSLVQLDGSNSVDSDGDIIAYEWKQVSGPSVSLSDTTIAMPTFSAPNVGSSGAALIFELTVTDDDNFSGSTTGFVNVVNKNTPPVAYAGGNQTVAKGITVELDGAGSSDPDTGDTITSYAWSQISGPAVTLSDPTASMPTFTAPDNSGSISLEFQLLVKDNGGLIGIDTCIVNVTSTNAPPIADADSDLIAAPDESVRLDGSNASDPEDGSSIDFFWRQLSGRSVTLSDPTASQPVFIAPDTKGADLLIFQLTVTDSEGLRDTDTIAVTVTRVKDFVTRFYQLCLNRNPDPAGLRGWTEALLKGTLTGSEVGFGFVFSTEFIDQNTTDEAFLAVLYKAFFNRLPDTIGKSGWIDAMQRGITREDVLNGFLFSAEFNELCREYGIMPNPVAAFVARFYQLCLDRDPDAPGLDGWVSGLLAGNLTGSDVAGGFIFSSEFSNKNISDAEYLTILYRAFFNREPDPDGLQAWRDAISSGSTRADVLDGFLYSREFAELCANYGITPNK